MEELKLNQHNKEEYPPMHTTEHIINRTMINLFGCGRSVEAHIERKKSKLDYKLPACPTPEQVQQLEDTVNEVIHHPSRGTRPLRHETSARRCLPDRSRSKGRRLRRVPLYRTARSEHQRDWHVQAIEPWLQSRHGHLAHKIQAG